MPCFPKGSALIKKWGTVGCSLQNTKQQHPKVTNICKNVLVKIIENILLCGNVDFICCVCEIIVTADLYLPKGSKSSQTLHPHDFNKAACFCLSTFFFILRQYFQRKRVTTLRFIMIFEMILQMWKRERASCPSSVCFLDLKGVWSGSSLEGLLREMAKSLPSFSSGKPQLLPGGRVAWSTFPETTAGARGNELGLETMNTAIRAQEPSLTRPVCWVESVLGQSTPELNFPCPSGETFITSPHFSFITPFRGPVALSVLQRKK